MNGIIFDLKSFRANQLDGISQEKFAKQVGISQDRVSRMEADPSQVTLEVLCKISAHFGISLDQLVGNPKPVVEPLVVCDTWSAADYKRRMFLEYLSDNCIDEKYCKELSELKLLITKLYRKPKVAFIGRSDTGKSTMINTLLGGKRMPVSWTPTTAIAVYIKHIKDRPDYMDEEVWIFKSDDISKEIWDDTRLSDEAYCRSMRICSGNYDLLNTYGTRQGENFTSAEPTSAVVFLDSDLLLNCDIIDIPGYGTGDRIEDDALSLSVKNKADVLIYLSIANGFMRCEDAEYLREAMNSLVDIHTYSDGKIKPLANLFIVASQAHVIDGGDQTALECILNAGAERFERRLSDEFWRDKSKPDALAERFYYYSSNTCNLRSHFENDFAMLIEALPKVVEEKAKYAITAWRERTIDSLKKLIIANQTLLEERQNIEQVLKQYEENEPQRYEAFENAKKRVRDGIRKYKAECVDEIVDYYSQLITEDNLTSLIEKRKIKNNREDKEIFCSYVSGLLENRTNAIIKKKSALLTKDIDEFLDNFEIHAKISVESISVNIPIFNKEQAFAAGLAGLSTYGGLALWAASCGNLGGYILIAKGVSLLSALGIHVGGTAVAASTIAALGGPAVIGIGLAAVAAVGAAALFSEDWSKRFAKKLVASCKEKKVLESLENSINNFWRETQYAFNEAAHSLDGEWKKYVKELRAKLSPDGKAIIEEEQKEAKRLLEVIQNLPI